MQLKLPTLEWQRSLINDHESAVIACSGGLRSSKTHGAVLRHFVLCLINKNSEFSAFIEPNDGLIKRVAIPLFRKVLKSVGFKEKLHYTITYGAPFPTLRLIITGQEIHFLTGSQPDSIVGSEYSHATIDEADENPIETFRNIRSRLSDSTAVVRQLGIFGAPQGINWFAENFDSETQDGWDLEGKYNWYNKKRNFRRFRLVTDDNPFLPDGYLDEMMDTYGHNKNLVKAYRYGIFTPLFEGTAYNAFLEERDVSKTKIDPDPRRPIYLTFDFNAQPLVWIAVQILPHPTIPNRNIYNVIDEADEGRDGLDDALYDFCMKFSPDKFKSTEIRIYGDRSGYQSHHRHKSDDYQYITGELRQFYERVYVEASRKVAPETGSVESVNRCFAHGRIVLTPHVRGLIRSFQATCWKEAIRKLDKPAGETWTHRSDAFKYLIYQLEVIDSLNAKGRIYGINI